MILFWLVNLKRKKNKFLKLLIGWFTHYMTTYNFYFESLCFILGYFLNGSFYLLFFFYITFGWDSHTFILLWLIWSIWKAWLLTTTLVICFSFFFPPDKRWKKKRKMNIVNSDKKSCFSVRSIDTVDENIIATIKMRNNFCYP